VGYRIVETSLGDGALGIIDNRLMGYAPKVLPPVKKPTKMTGDETGQT
jgi:hypothetical protein